MNISEIKRELEFAKARGGYQAKIAQIGLRLCARIMQLEKEKAERSQSDTLRRRHGAQDSDWHMKKCDYCDGKEALPMTAEMLVYGRTCHECMREQEPHPCPFSSEIHGDDETLCTCSIAAQAQCAWDV